MSATEEIRICRSADRKAILVDNINLNAIREDDPRILKSRLLVGRKALWVQKIGDKLHWFEGTLGPGMFYLLDCMSYFFNYTITHVIHLDRSNNPTPLFIQDLPTTEEMDRTPRQSQGK